MQSLNLFTAVRPNIFFFKQKTAYEIHCVTGVQTCALPILIVIADGCALPSTSLPRIMIDLDPSRLVREKLSPVRLRLRVEEAPGRPSLSRPPGTRFGLADRKSVV